MALNFFNPEIQLINIYIGLNLRYERLNKKISQYDLAIQCGIDNTAIGRTERAEHISSWSTIYLISKCLNIDFNSLFLLKTKDEILSVVEKCYSLETKLTSNKKNYYKNLVINISDLYSKL